MPLYCAVCLPPVCVCVFKIPTLGLGYLNGQFVFVIEVRSELLYLLKSDRLILVEKEGSS